MQRDLTQGKILPVLIRFSIPFLISSFLQTFYGLADLFITGQFYGAAEITAVSVGSQIMHMVTLIIVGLSMGATISISHEMGTLSGKVNRAEDPDCKRTYGHIAEILGNAILLFIGIAIVLLGILVGLRSPVLMALRTPTESLESAKAYLTIVALGIPAIAGLNVVSGVFRGMGDSRTPMYFVAVSGVLNIGLDNLFMGPFGLGAAGAALATVIAQVFSVFLAVLTLIRKNPGIHLKRADFRLNSGITNKMLHIGTPIALQDGLIQISFLVITAIANNRGVDIAAAVGIVEKMISFIFLVPSAMLSTVSDISAQNVGAGKYDRTRETLRIGILICLEFGFVIAVLVQFLAPVTMSWFTGDPEVITYGAEYFRTYVLDCMIAGVHFCFSGFFTAYGKSSYAFIHNMISVIAVRIPGAYLTSMWFPSTLLPMGAAAPLGSLVSVIICIYFYKRLKRAGFALQLHTR